MADGEDKGGPPPEAFDVSVDEANQLDCLDRQADRWLSENPSGAVWSLASDERGAVGKYSTQIFYWFCSLTNVQQLTEIDDYLALKNMPFPIEKPNLRLFKRELCPRVADFYRQNKDIGAIATHFKLDGVVCQLAIMLHAFQYQDYDLDVLSMLRHDELDHHTYNMVHEFVVREALANFRSPPPDGFIAHPAALVCHTLLRPYDLCILLSVLFKEATYGREARVNWNLITVLCRPYPVDALIKYDQMLLEAAEESLLERKTENDKIAKLSQQMDTLELQMEGHMAQLEGLGKVLNQFGLPELKALKEIAMDLRKARLQGIQEVLPGDYEEEPDDVVEDEDLQVVGRVNVDVSSFPSRLDPASLTIQPGDACLAREHNNSRSPFRKARLTKVVEEGRRFGVIFDGYVSEIIVNDSDLALLEVKVPIMCEGVRVAAFASNPNGVPGSASNFFSGVIAYRREIKQDQYLTFFDDGFENYVNRVDQCYVLYQQTFDFNGYIAKGEVHQLIAPHVRNENMRSDRQRFFQEYFFKYPDWQMMRMKKNPPGQRVSEVYLKAYSRQGTRWSTIVMDVDRHLCTLRFNPLNGLSSIMNCMKNPCDLHVHTDEVIYRGSPRLCQMKQVWSQQSQASLLSDPNLSASKQASSLRRQHRRQQATAAIFESTVPHGTAIRRQQEEGSKRTARKTGQSVGRENAMTNVTVGRTAQISKSRKKWVSKMKIEHQTVDPFEYNTNAFHNECSWECLKGMDAQPSSNRFDSCSPFFIPAHCSWRRHQMELLTSSRGRRRSFVYYRAPCGRSLFSMNGIAEYLKQTGSQLTIDLFTLDKDVDENKWAAMPEEWVQKADFTEGKESRPIPVVNDIDNQQVENFMYSSLRFAVSEEVDFSTVNKEYCSGCSCIDDCMDSSKCECQQLTATLSRRLAGSLRLEGVAHYDYRRLPFRFLSGIYECNENCQCSRKRCYNRVVQNDIRVPLQMMKTPAMGWGVRTLCDLPAGTFICNYHGAILTDEIAENWTAGDEYFADLDLMRCVEIEKQNGGIDLIADHGIDVDLSDADEYKALKRDQEDVDYIEDMGSESDDGESGKPEERVGRKKPRAVLEKADATVREETEGNAAGEAARQHWHATEDKYDFEVYFENSGHTSLYIADAKSRGNIGRFLNHSCDPNVHVQHVMVDTHDMRLPWVSFFTKRSVKAGEELFWDYGWTPTEGCRRNLKCQCGASNCRLDLL